MMLHTADAVQQGLKIIVLRTVDTDVVVLAVAAVPKLHNTQLWLAFGVGQHFRHIPAHEIAASLGPRKSIALPMFHAFTGCDTVSSFASRGKKTAWETWMAYEEATETFLALTNAPQELDDESFAVLARYTILLYRHGYILTNLINMSVKLFSTVSIVFFPVDFKSARYHSGFCIFN